MGRKREDVMPRRVLACTLLLLASAAIIGLRAETFPYDHMHFNAADPAAAVAWYATNLGAKHGALPDRVVIGRTIFAFAKLENAPPSGGSAIDHIGFSVADVEAKMKELQAAGAKVITPARDVPGLPKAGFVQDPFGVKIELLQDPETPGFHHIHLRVPDPDASLRWSAENFGGERLKWKGRLDAVKYTNPTVWLLAEKGDDAPPSQGRAIDHLGWAVTNVDAKVSDLASKGLKTVEPRAVRNLRVGFVDGPGGVRIEMVQGRTEEELIGR
jgi:catechol 2,3-dioxygenase-like lactoylglutathione lyase family enzyme